MSEFGDQLLGLGYNQLTMQQQQWNQQALNQQQQRYNLDLQQNQFENQQALNQQGHNLQLDMWNKTNFGAQMEHLKKAGLNPALMYKQGGAGGQTGSQGGGSAVGGSAGLGMAPLGPEFQLYGAQREKMLAEADAAQAAADATRGYEKDESVSRAELNRANKLATEWGVDFTKKQIENMTEQTRMLKTQLETEYDTDQGIGSNYTKNVIDFLSGKYDLSTYIGVASALMVMVPLARGGWIAGQMLAKSAATQAAAKAIIIKLAKIAGVGLGAFGLNWVYQDSKEEIKLKEKQEIKEKNNQEYDTYKWNDKTQSYEPYDYKSKKFLEDSMDILHQ